MKSLKQIYKKKYFSEVISILLAIILFFGSLPFVKSVAEAQGSVTSLEDKYVFVGVLKDNNNISQIFYIVGNTLDEKEINEYGQKIKNVAEVSSSTLDEIAQLEDFQETTESTETTEISENIGSTKNNDGETIPTTEQVQNIKLSNDKEAKITILTNENNPSKDPVFDGRSIAWTTQINGYWQIFIHDIEVQTTAQLTYIGNNVNPQISEGILVWEGQVEGIWQIFIYKDSRIKQLTNGTLPKQDVIIKNEFIAYSSLEKTVKRQGWKIYLYDTNTEKTINISKDKFGREPKFLEGAINWTSTSDQVEAEFIFDEVAYKNFLKQIGQENTDSNLGFFESSDKSEIEQLEDLLDKAQGKKENEISIDEVEIELGIKEAPYEDTIELLTEEELDEIFERTERILDSETKESSESTNSQR